VEQIAYIQAIPIEAKIKRNEFFSYAAGNSAITQETYYQYINSGEFGFQLNFIMHTILHFSKAAVILKQIYRIF
jgi:hypothetical protein